MKILVTGSAGFIAGYLVDELLRHGHTVVGIDNYSKYGRVEKSYDRHPDYHFTEGDAKDTALLKDLVEDCDQVIALAAIIGGISLFHEYAYDLLAENERITAATFDAAIWAHKNKHLQKINVVSSSMVFENAGEFPTREGDQFKVPPPLSTYGFQKLATEYFARGAWEQYQLPHTIIRPFNCIGVGEKRAIYDRVVLSGNIRLAMSHVVPDLVQKVLKGQDPLHILGSGDQVRHYTYGGDLAEGMRLCVESGQARTKISTCPPPFRPPCWNSPGSSGKRSTGRGRSSSPAMLPSSMTSRSASRRWIKQKGSSAMRPTQPWMRPSMRSSRGSRRRSRSEGFDGSTTHLCPALQPGPQIQG